MGVEVNLIQHEMKQCKPSLKLKHSATLNIQFTSVNVYFRQDSTFITQYAITWTSAGAYLMIRYYYRLRYWEVVIFVQYKGHWNYKVQNTDLTHNLAYVVVIADTNVGKYTYKHTFRKDTMKLPKTSCGIHITCYPVEIGSAELNIHLPSTCLH
jgi:hypothetical protein